MVDAGGRGGRRKNFLDSAPASVVLVPIGTVNDPTSPSSSSKDALSALRERLAAETAARAAAEAAVVELRSKLERAVAERDALKSRLDELLRNLHRKKADKIDPEEIERAFAAEFGDEGAGPAPEGAPKVPDDEETAATKRERRNAPKRRPPPSHLERVDEDLRPEPRECCGEPMKDAGVEYSEKLDYVPSHFRRRRIVKHKLACAMRDHVVIRPGPPPDHPLERCGATVELLAKVATEKYDRHIPLNRQCEEAERLGVPLAKSTLCGWLAELAFVLSPIEREIRRQVAAGFHVNFDDTGVVVLDPTEKGGSRKGAIWTYVGREAAAYDYSDARTSDAPARVLKDFKGFAQCDAATQHDALFAPGSGRIEVGCLAHARRYFVKAAPTNGAVAKVALAFFLRLYRVEAEAKNATPGERREIRRRRSSPLWRKFLVWARKRAAETLPKGPLGKAFGYLLRHRRALRMYVKDGRLPPDNNAAERALRTVAVGRKNWEFAGSVDGARRAALYYTLMYSCRLAGVDPYVWLVDVLKRISEHPQSAVAALTPAAWKAARESAAAAANA